jgi:hypothetical protein
VERVGAGGARIEGGAAAAAARPPRSTSRAGLRATPAAPFSGLDVGRWLRATASSAQVSAHAPVAHVENALRAEVERLGCDLVVMGLLRPQPDPRAGVRRRHARSLLRSCRRRC